MTTTSNIDFNDPLLQQAIRDYQDFYTSAFREILEKSFAPEEAEDQIISAGKIESSDGSAGWDLANGVFWATVEEVEYPETEFRTDSGCEYSIFEDDEEEETFHIDVDPDWRWNKDDVWELIQKLLYTIGEIDGDGKQVSKEPEKQLFIISTPGKISEEVGNVIGLHAKEALEKANIDAVPLILSEGLKAYFEKPRA